MLEHLGTKFVPFSVGEINYVTDNVYRPPNTNNDEYMSELSNILNNALTDFPNSIFINYVMLTMILFRSTQTMDLWSFI